MTLSGSDIVEVPNADGSGDYNLGQPSASNRPLYGANGPLFNSTAPNPDHLELYYPGGAGGTNDTFVFLYKGIINDLGVFLSKLGTAQIDPVIQAGSTNTGILQAASSIIIDGTTYTNGSGTTRDNMHTLLSTNTVHKVLLTGVNHSAVDTAYLGFAKHINSRAVDGVLVLVGISDGDDANYASGLTAVDALQDKLIAELGL